MNSLEQYFDPFRSNIIGIDFEHPFEYGRKKILYADWAASGRLYRPIEEYISNSLGPYVANTHTETTLTGTMMTHAYHQAHSIIKKHVNASPDDQLLFVGAGMTAAVNKFQRILGLRVPEKFRDSINLSDDNRPLVVITHMEHHSNQTTWVECLCDVKIVNRDKNGLPDLNHLQEILKTHKNRTLIIGSFSACSNVTGILTPYHQMAEIVHEYGGYCFVDFSASAPYVEINMHPQNEKQALDAIFFSPHKFLGGPGSSGVIVFHKSLYQNAVPDHPGGGTVTWTNPWGEHHYFDDIEIREDGGTPGFLQGIKASLSILLKEEMGIGKMLEREHYLKERLMERLANIPQLNMLETNQRRRMGFISFYMEGLHHNLIVRLLNDRFGIQTRGGCSCAGTYGHILLNINYDESHRITNMIDIGDLSQKPGWVRISLHPTMRDEEVEYIADSLEEILKNHTVWKGNYRFNVHTGDFDPVNLHQREINIKESFHCL
jgi:selenocysteine lyase/cysteine desulfurase